MTGDGRWDMGNGRQEKEEGERRRERRDGREFYDVYPTNLALIT